ncbi:MAG TPA: ATP-binding protein [Flavobacteriaceae bacterium]|nr:ATP-binding protein [Flavobacteriaceae bacterium]
MKLTFRQRLFLYVAFLFIVVTTGIAVFENSREKHFKTEALKEHLEIYTEVIQAKLVENKDSQTISLEDIHNVFPDELRITILDLSGNVLFDNAVENADALENHIDRKEIIDARISSTGSNIRRSESTAIKYLYFAKKYPQNYIRVALPYDIQVQQFIKADNLFLYFLLTIGGISLYLIHRITTQFGASIKRLHNFAIEPSDTSINFSNDEIGIIGNKILENYKQIDEHKKNLTLERQKLLQHIQVLEEGICFISPQKEIEFYNALFIQYLNTLSDEPSSDAKTVLIDTVFQDVQQFIEKGKTSFFETTLQKHGKTFSLRANRFDDNSFEIILNDITKEEKTKMLKREMTGNIAHELRTPVTSIRGYLETVLNLPIDDEKKRYFIEKAFNQTLELSNLIADVSLLAKIDEASVPFAFEKVNIFDIVHDLKEENRKRLSNKNSRFNIEIPKNIYITGNKSLLISIFRNLLENALRYGGDNIEIALRLYKEDADLYYFSFYDTGIGIADEKQLNRIFERFYRLSEGRTRDSGGSGLGLSIVKNAIQFHNGKITVKNRKEGGLEFLFSFQKGE